MKHEKIISDLINGNLDDAKQRAKNASHKSLWQAYREMTGCADPVALAAADFLKGKGTFQAYSDAEHAARVVAKS